jgi:hypothetical protein
VLAQVTTISSMIAITLEKPRQKLEVPGTAAEAAVNVKKKRSKKWKTKWKD